MRAQLRIALFGLCAGVFIGGLSGLRWLSVSYAILGSPLPFPRAYLSIFLPILLLSIACLSWLLLIRAYHVSYRTTVHLLLSIGAAIIFYCAAHAFYNAAPAAGLSFTFIFLLLSLLAILVAFLLNRRNIIMVGVPFATTASSAVHNAYIFTGDQLAQGAALYAPPIAWSHYLQIYALFAAISLVAGSFYVFFTRSNAWESLYKSIIAGILLSSLICITHATAYYSTMMSGQNPNAILISHLLPWALILPALLLGAREWSTRGPSLLLKIAPAFLVLVFSSYCYLSTIGYADYAAISRSHPDKAIAYVHFLSDGSVRRTLDLTGSSVRDWRAQYFLTAYPYSAYRPAALIRAAECAYENWNFDQAVEMAGQYNREYPFLRGYSDVLAALASFSAGDMSAMHSSCSLSSYFAGWRSTQGAQIAAFAALRLGLPNKARGYTSAYIDYLRSEQPAIWYPDAFAYADRHLQRINNSTTSSDNPFKTGTVSIRVLCGSRPVPGAKVILAQPHIDASLTSDSMQFTGAWSIPVWNGMWAVTDTKGKAVINDVPYGSYELVVGIGLRDIPLGYVADSQAEKVEVHNSNTELAAIRFVPAVRLLYPAAGGAVSHSPTLRWKPYPAAESYSVSVMELNNAQGDPSSDLHQLQGTTCWAKAGIKAPQVCIDASGFIGNSPGLKGGANYMWLVYAYGSDGRQVSSSEHYFQLSEPTFVVR